MHIATDAKLTGMGGDPLKPDSSYVEDDESIVSITPDVTGCPAGQGFFEELDPRLWPNEKSNTSGPALETTQSPIYHALGGAAGCHALATAFYARVERDPILRPFFPSTFTCAIEEFSAFLVQFLGGEAEASQRRWWLSLRESHSRFVIGSRERDAWLGAMSETLGDESLIPDSRVRSELLEFFTHSSAHVVNTKDFNEAKTLAEHPLSGELAPLWKEQLALDEAVALLGAPDRAARCIELLQEPALQARFARSPEVHASVLSLAATSKSPLLRQYAANRLRSDPSLVHQRYKHSRTLLHDASGAGDLALVELLLDLGAGSIAADGEARSPLYCVGNECRSPGGGRIVQALLQRSSARVNAIHGVKRCTALHMAARRGNVEVIGALLDGGANIEARDSAGDTPLRRAVNCDKVEAAKLLLARGADRYSVGNKALTPVRAARSLRMKQLFTGPGSTHTIE
jgi:hemoglobin